MTTHCNCNGNLIPSGNDFYLAIALKSRSLVDGEVVETPFDFEAADTYNARIYSIIDGKTLSTMVGLKDGSTDTVIIDAKGVPLIRAIGVEVTGTVDGRAFRAAEKGFLSIVEFNGEAKVVFTPVTGGQQANLVMTLTFLPSAAVVGKNAYEIWKEEPGNQDKTLSDFIYFLGHGESAYEIAVRYGYTGTEAEYNMLYFDAVDVANTAGQNAQQAADTANQMAAQAQDAAELADAATTNANNAATAAAATVDAAIDNMEDTLNAAIAAQDAEIDAEFATQTAIINQKQMKIGAVPSDLTPTAGSTNWVTSGGVYATTPSINNGADSADLFIADETNNAIATFSEGHVQTKNFNSANVPTRTEVENSHPVKVEGNEVADLSLMDELGFSVADFYNGHIRTKYFNSASLRIESYPLLYTNEIYPFGFDASRFFKRAGKRSFFKDAAPLIIVAGQSNADGRIPYTSAPSWLSSNNYAINNYMVWDTATKTFQTYNVKGMTGNGGAVAGSDGTGENKFTFDAYFAHDFLSEYGGKLYLVRQTLGGIGIEDEPTTGTRNWTWNPDVDNIVSGCNSMCLALLQKVKDAFNFAKKNNITLIPICILWHQGEHDATAQYIGTLKQNLSNLIMWLRGVFLSPTLPFICAELNENYDQYYAQANSIFAELASDDDNMKCVSMAGHYTTMDGIHFDVDAIEYMGNQMFNNYKNVI